MKPVRTLAAPPVHDDPLTDIFVGSGADDTFFVDSVDDRVVEAPDGGVDRVLTTLSAWALPANVENLTYVGAGDFSGVGNELDNLIIGQGGDDLLMGGLGRDVLLGQAGDDWLEGGAGVANQMQGGLGNDTYVVGAVGDTIVEAAGEGVDSVLTVLSMLTLAAHVENLTYVGSGAFAGAGNASANTIRGETPATSWTGWTATTAFTAARATTRWRAAQAPTPSTGAMASTRLTIRPGRPPFGSISPLV